MFLRLLLALIALAMACTVVRAETAGVTEPESGAWPVQEEPAALVPTVTAVDAGEVVPESLLPDAQSLDFGGVPTPKTSIAEDVVGMPESRDLALAMVDEETVVTPAPSIRVPPASRGPGLSPAAWLWIFAAATITLAVLIYAIGRRRRRRASSGRQFSRSRGRSHRAHGSSRSTETSAPAATDAAGAQGEVEQQGGARRRRRSAAFGSAASVGSMATGDESAERRKRSSRNSRRRR